MPDTPELHRHAAADDSVAPPVRDISVGSGGLLPLASDAGPVAAPTLVPPDPAAALLGGDEGAGGVAEAREAARRCPSSSLAWALLAEIALTEGDDISAYAFARTGYHRGLDLLRRSGWRGTGPVPWSHVPNRGFLRSVAALAVAADRIGEEPERLRCAQLLSDSDPMATELLLP